MICLGVWISPPIFFAVNIYIYMLKDNGWANNDPESLQGFKKQKDVLFLFWSNILEKKNRDVAKNKT